MTFQKAGKMRGTSRAPFKAYRTPQRPRDRPWVSHACQHQAGHLSDTETSSTCARARWQPPKAPETPGCLQDQHQGTEMPASNLANGWSNPTVPTAIQRPGPILPINTGLGGLLELILSWVLGGIS